MCEDCGCGITDHFHAGSHSNLHTKEREAPVLRKVSEASLKHAHVKGGQALSGGASSNPALSDAGTVTVLKNILHENDLQASHLREHFANKNIYAVNLMGSPGCGKTTLLEKTAERIKDEIAVLEGDLETTRDADRITACGVRAYQIQTGSACHLDAFMIHDAIHHFQLPENGILFIENVGNLVCPAAYDTGAHLNVVILSVPEGDDKVAKYPVIFRSADILIVSKTDLIPYVKFDLDRVKTDFRKLNQSADFITISDKDENSISRWVEYLTMKRKFRS